MIIVNFSHPLTAQQIQQLQSLGTATVERVIDVKTQLEESAGFTAQVAALVDSVGFSPADWQTLPFAVNLPSLSIAAALVLSEIHGRAGFFPAVLRARPLKDTLLREFEIAEILNLQAVRDAARTRR